MSAASYTAQMKFCRKGTQAGIKQTYGMFRTHSSKLSSPHSREIFDKISAAA